MQTSWVPFVPPSASTLSGKVDALYFYLSGVTIFFAVLISGVLIFFVIKYRRRSPFEIPRPVAGSHKLETLWSVIPFVIAMTMFAWGAQIFFEQSKAPKNAVEVYVVGKQWMWKIQHPSGRREINTLHVPVGTPIRLTLASQDVIHSFFIPAMRMKMDAVPGRYTVTWFEPTKTGEYHLFCTEYCGTDHSRMIGRVVVMEPEAYPEWTSGASDIHPPVEAGAQLFQTLQCVTCHGVQAPTMAGLFGSQRKFADGSTQTADEQYLRESILDSTSKVVEGYPPIMPSYRGQVTEDQLLQLIAYIKSLKDPKDITIAPRAAPEQPN